MPIVPLALVGLAAGAVLTACSPDQTASTASSDTAAPSASSASAEGQRVVTTEFGEVSVPEDIDSVVILEGRRDLDTALTLGLPLTGMPALDSADYDLPLPYAEQLEKAKAEYGTKELFTEDEINIEAIAAAQPDLIISRASDVEPIRAELEAIAPVLPVGEQTTSTWQDDLRLVGEATGTEDKAEEAIKAYEERVEKLKETYASQLADNSFVAAKIESEGSEVRPQRVMSAVLADLGATPSKAMSTAIAEDKAEFSPEQLLQAYEDADAMIVHSNTADAWEGVQADPLYQQLPAVEDGHVVRSNKFTFEGSAITAQHALDVIEELLKTL